MVWELTGASGTTTTTRLGGTLTATSIVDGQGLLTSLKTVMGSTVLRDMNFQFNATTGNLTWRTGVNSQKETFEYDDLDRLKNTKTGEAEVVTMAIAYHPNGNISSKTSLGTYGYHPTKLHAVNSVDNYEGLIPAIGQSISYNSFNKADCLKDTIGTNDYQLDIVYGPDQQRWKSVLKSNGTAKKTIIFAGDYEKFIDNTNGITRELYYIEADDGLAAIYVKTNGQGIMYYAQTDHQGSIISLTDSAGVAVFKASYDAWGKQTVSLNTIGFHRGYTGHEHLPEFGLINMNGRMYEPVLGRFLSPDNYVQAADFSQSYNRYSYCGNNPLKYTDPSGEVIAELISIAALAYFGGLEVNAKYAFDNGDNPFNPGNWNWENPWTYVGIGSGALEGYSQSLQHCEYLIDINTGEKILYSHLGDGKLNFKYYGEWVDNHSGFKLRNSVVEVVPFGGVDNIRKMTRSTFMVNGLLNISNSLKGVVVDNNWQATKHYLFGDGSPARIGANTTNSLLNSPEFLDAHNAILSGEAKPIDKFSVNMRNRVFHIGKTNVNYTVSPDNNRVTYKLYDKDGFWDPDFLDEKYLRNSPYFKPDNMGPNLERFNGIPYHYIPTVITFPIRIY